MFSASDIIFLPLGTAQPKQLSGGFARRIAVVLPSGAGSSGQQDFLVKILAAAHINLEKDTLLLEVEPSEPISLLPLLREKQPEHILLFGLTPAQAGLSIEAPLYKPFEFYGAGWLFAESLAVLEPDKARKGLLWRALQQLFL